MNKTMYGLKLYIPFEDLDDCIHNHTEEKYKDHTFIPIKAEVNELDLGVEITLISVNPIEHDGSRYKFDINLEHYDKKPQRGLRARLNLFDEVANPCCSCESYEYGDPKCPTCRKNNYKFFEEKTNHD